ncbi:flagellar biosynthesis repressor FlbT [Falsigemmobacter intermedius]|uniref:Flagellar biosynthesis repressor FlbT n=1 Tax=Falsigemmobacter intermedius TaxID=1553448 RepID=A0A3S3YA56_9RHOB|nr:flagellar biosynthesis repressor FlbT [Falsigemmobacter intermedius]RWY36620.1 flagellar biosynthesis repressor FlbT [Falsigemmobacter intermedius]
MSGLVLKLGPHERVLINGAVIENSERRIRFSILTPGANVLRMRDAIHPDDVTTPVRRLCYMAQLLLSGDMREDGARLQLLRGIEEISQIMTDADSRLLLAAASQAVLEEAPYQALKALRALLPRERRLLAAARQ